MAIRSMPLLAMTMMTVAGGHAAATTAIGDVVSFKKTGADTVLITAKYVSQPSPSRCNTEIRN